MTTADDRKRAKEAHEAELRTEARRVMARICAGFFDYLARKGIVPADQRDTLIEHYMKEREAAVKSGDKSGTSPDQRRDKGR
jgi:hypothetical protein